VEDLPLLGENQDRFIHEYLIDLNGTQAYQRVYHCSYMAAKTGAARLLANPSVQEHLSYRKNELARAASFSADYIIQALKMVIERSLQIDVPRNAFGAPIIHTTQYGEKYQLPYKFDGKTAVRALQVLGQYLPNKPGSIKDIFQNRSPEDETRGNSIITIKEVDSGTLNNTKIIKHHQEVE